MDITHDYFLKEYHAFRNIMCSKKYTIQQKDEAYKGLLHVYMLCNDESGKDQRITAMVALDEEYARRIALELFSF